MTYDVKGKLISVGLGLDEIARNVNIYRAASFAVAKSNGAGARHFYDANTANDLLGDFDTHDQDNHRPDWARKLQLCYCGESTARRLSGLLKHAQATPTRNLALLHELYRARLAVFGDKSPQDSLAYARRSALKLHPDLNSDLKGWEYPGVVYWKGLPPGYKYEHALHGAAALFSLHNSLKTIISEPHYQKALWSKTTARGPELTPRQLASDTTLGTIIGVLYCIFRGKGIGLLLTYSGGIYLLLLAVSIKRAVARKRAEARGVKCRELTLYNPSSKFKGARYDTVA